MKSERRHELQQSEMVREFGKVRQFFHKWGNHLAWGVLIAAVIFAIGFYAYRSRRQKQDQLLARLNRVQTASLSQADSLSQAEHINELQELAGQQDNRRVAAQAGVLLGDGYFVQYVVGGEDDDFPLEPEEALNQAEQAYRRVIEQYGDFPRRVSRARYGLAKILETRQRFDEARKQYQAILDLPGLEGDPIVMLASEDAEAIDDLRQPVKLSETQPATTTEPAPLPPGPDALPESPVPSDQPLPGTPPAVPETPEGDEP
ncbi:MAG: hypothetical protein ACLFVW_07600 [Phycisphaerae bacterium]